MNEQLLNQVLKKKINNVTEIEIHLFEFCNLSCRFCGQDHDSKVGFESIRDKALDVVAFIHKSSMQSHIINIMGGEVFNDLIPEDLFDDYKYFAETIFSYAREHNQYITMNWVTNLIFHKKERVWNLLHGLTDIPGELNLSTSYDFEGRGYAGKVNSLFAKNLYEFKEKIYTIGFVLTSPAIRNFIEGHDPFFEKIKDDFTLYFDYYVPEETNCDELMPTDQELYDAFIYAATHYPNVYPVRDWLENKENKMTCYSLNKVTILPDGQQVTCRYLNYKKGSFHNEIDYKSNANIVTSYIEKNNCLNCKHYDRCTFRCFVQADWVKREEMPGCLYAKFFDDMKLEHPWS